MVYTLSNPDAFKVDASLLGGSQQWYGDKYMRMSGCGPTAASNLVWYFARSRPHLADLCDAGSGETQAFLALMEEMFTFVTPRTGGVNKPEIFSDGVAAYGKSHGFHLELSTIKVPNIARKRPALKGVEDFITGGLQKDAPVAFLNLSNGSMKTLESWHWVTITGYDSGTRMLFIADQSKMIDIPLDKWMKTSILGGAFVRPDKAEKI